MLGHNFIHRSPPPSPSPSLAHSTDRPPTTSSSRPPPSVLQVWERRIHSEAPSETDWDPDEISSREVSPDLDSPERERSSRTFRQHHNDVVVPSPLLPDRVNNGPPPLPDQVNNGPPPEQVRRRGELRIRGAQARQELVRRMKGERDKELSALQEHKAVSRFAHRGRIQAHLRGRFLRPNEEEREARVAQGELAQLLEGHHVSGLREEFRFRLEATLARGQSQSQTTSAPHSQCQSQPASQSDASTSEPSRNSPPELTINNQETNNNQEIISRPSTSSVDNNSNSGDSFILVDLNPQEAQTHENSEEEEQAVENEEREEEGGGERNGEDEHWGDEMDFLLEEDQQSLSPTHSLSAVDRQFLSPADSLSPVHQQFLSPTTQLNRFSPTDDDDHAYSPEILELLNRQTVSNLLQSGFRQNLDRLISNYISRQGHGALSWGMPVFPPPPPSNPPQDDELLSERDSQTTGEDHHGDDNGDDDDDDGEVMMTGRINNNNSIPPPPPPPPPRLPAFPARTMWMPPGGRSRAARWPNRPEIEWEAISELRAEMGRLQQGMVKMQSMLETCMDVQLELQRSVRQEVSAALNRFVGPQGASEVALDDGLKWSQVRKGTCCKCHQSQIDSLLYRCGHMCTCSKCANELVRNGGKCPLCKAPIVEVVRAYFIM